jgi:hypothetical protein
MCTSFAPPLVTALCHGCRGIASPHRFGAFWSRRSVMSRRAERFFAATRKAVPEKNTRDPAGRGTTKAPHAGYGRWCSCRQVGSIRAALADRNRLRASGLWRSAGPGPSPIAKSSTLGSPWDVPTAAAATGQEQVYLRESARAAVVPGWWRREVASARRRFFVAKLAATFMGGAALRERRLECRWTSGGGSIGDAKRWLG